MLEINKGNKFFGGLKAVHNASMKVEMGSITGLIGQMVREKQHYLILLQDYMIQMKEI